MCRLRALIFYRTNMPCQSVIQPVSHSVVADNSARDYHINCLISMKDGFFILLLTTYYTTVWAACESRREEQSATNSIELGR